MLFISYAHSMKMSNVFETFSTILDVNIFIILNLSIKSMFYLKNLYDYVILFLMKKEGINLCHL